MCRVNDVNVHWIVFPLHTDTPEEGRALTDLFAGLDVAKAMAELQDIAATLGVPFGERTHTYNSRRAQELGKWAEAEGQGAAYRAAVFHAYFVNGENIADQSVLLDICLRLGLSHEGAKTVLDQRLFAADVDDDWQDASRSGITSIPSHRCREHVMVGYHSTAALVDFIKP